MSTLELPAIAQEEGKLPIKKNAPIIDRRALQIPGKVPDLKAVPPKKPVPVLNTGTPATEPPPPPPRPAPGDEEGAPGLGDITKVAESGCRPLRPRDKIMFEFKDADIKDVVTAISKTMCKNFILTSKVRSQKFDIISPQRITVEEAWRAFLSALEANDFTVFQVGRYYKIIQANDGTRAPVPVYDDEEKYPINDRMVTKIWKLEHPGDVNAVVNYLNIFKSSRGQIHPFAATNTLVATDFATSLERLERILDEIDTPGVSERVHVVTVDYASATEIAEKLNQIFEPSKAAAPGQKPGAPRAGAAAVQQQPGKRTGAKVAVPTDGISVSKILADDRTNKLIIIASNESFKQIMALKKKLDIPSEVGEGQVHVLRLKHANAEELASTLASLASGKPTSAARSRVGAKPGAPGAPAAPPPAPGGTQATLFQGDIKVTADKPTNSLVITASKADFNSMKRVIAELDVPRLQVFVEAVILEVAMKRDRNLGVTWHGAAVPQVGNKDAPVVFGFGPAQEFNSLALTTNPLSLIGITGLAGAWRGPPAPGTENIVPGGIPAFGVVLQALQSNNDVNVISTPHLLTMDNEEAEIQVSEKRPFSSGLSLGNLAGLASNALGGGASAGLAGGLSGLSGLGLGSVNINREDIGLTLKLKPQINDQEFVRLEIDQELSDVAGVDPVLNQTITSKRAAKTVVVVRDQDSVVIGGLVRDRESQGVSKIPLLGDIPLLGWLFKREVKNVEKTNLLLILTPYIIRGPQDFYSIYKRKMEERKDFVMRYYGDVAEYRASVDWTRKSGPVATYRQELRGELLKPENGGPGAEGEEVIRSDEEGEDEGSTDNDPIDLPPGQQPPGEAPPAEAPPPPMNPEMTPPVEP
ncbi:MAG: type II secretion system secretin GspD [Deltaproteobacteria bacterium]|nr:type II secretion system secretin GspD [Deltaproteobacteria bacterium]